MNLKEIREELEKHDTKNIAAKTGLSCEKIRRIQTGYTKKPGYEDVVKLIKFLDGRK